MLFSARNGKIVVTVEPLCIRSSTRKDKGNSGVTVREIQCDQGETSNGRTREQEYALRLILVPIVIEEVVSGLQFGAIASNARELSDKLQDPTAKRVVEQLPRHGT